MRAAETSGPRRAARAVGMCWRAALLAAPAVLAVAGVARAQPAAIPRIEPGDAPWTRGVSLADREAAQRLFLEGTALMQKTLFAQAAEKYEQALARWDLPAIHYNLAIARFNLALDREALASVERAMRHGEAALGAARYRDAEKLRRQIERRLARMVITCDEPGARVSVDGAVLFEGPGTGEAVVAAGARVVVVEKSGYLTWTRTLGVSAGERLPIEVDLVSAEPVRERRWVWWKPWVIAGAGAAVVLGGGVAHALGARDFGAFNREFRDLDCASGEVTADPPHVDGCEPGDVGAASEATLARAERERAVAIGMYAVGGAALATGLVLAYLNRERIVPFAPLGELSAGPGQIRVNVRFEF